MYCIILQGSRRERRKEGLGKAAIEGRTHKDGQAGPGGLLQALSPEESQKCYSAQKVEMVIAATLLHRLFRMGLGWMGEFTGPVW